MDLSNVSEWIDAAVNASANRVDSLSFTISDERLGEIRADLTQQAINNARDKADALAHALDVQITGVKSARLFDFNGPPITLLSVSFATGAAESVAPAPIVPGQQTVTAIVAVIYKIG